MSGSVEVNMGTESSLTAHAIKRAHAERVVEDVETGHRARLPTERWRSQLEVYAREQGPAVELALDGPVL